MTDRLTLKANLVHPNQSLTLDFQGMFSQRKAFLSPNHGSMTFTCLGSGSNKAVFRIDGEPWVLAIAMNIEAEQDIRSEVETLRRIGLMQVNVPRPFQLGGASVEEIIFDVNGLWEGVEGNRKAFLQQLLPYTEMKKSNQPEKFVEYNILRRNTSKNIMSTAIKDLSSILRAYKQRPWGDFQVMYNSSTGNFYVFDPMPTPNPHSFGLKTPQQLLEGWIKDLEGAQNRGKHHPSFSNRKNPQFHH